MNTRYKKVRCRDCGRDCSIDEWEANGKRCPHCDSDREPAVVDPTEELRRDLLAGGGRPGPPEKDFRGDEPDLDSVLRPPRREDGTD